MFAAAAGIGFGYWLFRWALYHPSKYPIGDWDNQHLVDAVDAWIETADGVKLHGWWVERGDSPWATLFLHGNGDNLLAMAYRAEQIIVHGQSLGTAVAIDLASHRHCADPGRTFQRFAFLSYFSTAIATSLIQS